jgi:hypothetical protein
MTLYRVLALALIGTAVLGAPVLAADAPPTSIVVHSIDGKTTIVPVDSKMAKELLGNPNAKPLTAGMVVFVSEGKTYVIDDHKMPSGKMFIETYMGIPLVGN